MLLKNFEQHFESCVMNTQNAYKSVRNQTNGFNTSENELLKIFRGFRVSNMLYRKKWEPGKSTESFPNKKHPLLTVTITIKLLKSYQFFI